MSAPPGLEPAPTAWNDSQADRPETVEAAIRAAHDFIAAAGLNLRPRKVTRLVRAYLATRAAQQSFGAWLIAYADPTGETAVRNVLRERGR